MLKRQITIQNDSGKLEKLAKFIVGVANDWRLSDEMMFKLNLVIEEAVSNIILYGYKKHQKEEIIHLEMSLGKQAVRIKITDRAGEFNPLRVPRCLTISTNLSGNVK